MLNLNFIPFPIIETQRLVLRKITTEDAPEVFYMRSNQQVLKYINKTPAKTLEDALAFMRLIEEQEQKGECVTWAITLKGETKLKGTVCIWKIDKEHQRGELGYALHPDLHRQGIMDEVLKAVINFGFTCIKLHSLEANINPDNIASQKLLEKNGFVREGYFKENYFFEGKFLDSAIYSLVNTIKF